MLKELEGVKKEALTVSDAKEYARITTTTEDSYLAKLITSARIKAEQVLGRSIVPHKYQFEVREHDGEIELLYPNVTDPSTDEDFKVEYFDGSEWVELTEDEYDIYGVGEVNIGVSIAYQRVRITYNTEDINNEDVIRLIKELFVIYYDNRPDQNDLIKQVIERLSKYKICRIR